MIFNFIINPQSGHYSYQEVVDYIRLYAQDHPEFDYRLHLTERVGHATEIAKSITGEDNCIFAIGGDGTINEVLNGLNLECTLACVPIGSGNDFVKMLNYPKGLNTQEWLIETIEGKQIEIDFGLANDERFINSCNTGMDALVIVEFNKLRKLSIPNSMVYLLAVGKTIMKPVSQQIKLSIDDQTPYEVDSVLCALMNGKYYGNGFTPTPHAQIQDKQFELCQVDNLNLFKISKLINKYKKGTHVNDPAVHLHSCKNLVLESDKEMLYCLDGELKKSNKIVCKMSETPLKLRVSQRADIN